MAIWRLLPSYTPSTNLTDNVDYNMGLVFNVSQPGQVTHIRFWYTATDTFSPVTVRLYRQSDGAILGSGSTATPASGWNEVALSSPVSISSGINYVAAATCRRFHSESSYYTSAVTNGPITGVSGTNNVFGTDLTNMPTSSFNSSNYGRDVVFDDQSAGGVTVNLDGQSVTVTLNDVNVVTGAIFDLSGQSVTATLNDVSASEQVNLHWNPGNYLLAGHIQSAGVAPTPTENIISLWGFDDESGTTINDSEGSNDLTISGSDYHWFVPADNKSITGGCLRLNTSTNDTHLSRTDASLSTTFPCHSGGNGATTFAISVWGYTFEALVDNKNYAIINKHGQKGTGAYGGFLLNLNGPTDRHNAEFRVYKNDTDYTSLIANVDGYSGNWHHLVAQYRYVSDGLSEMELWLNNQLVASSSTAVGPPQANAQPLELGRLSDSVSATADYFSSSRLDQIHVVDFWLSSADINGLYNSYTVTPDPPPSQPTGDNLPTSVHASIVGVSQFQGSKLFIDWAAIETSQGVYSWTYLDEHVTYLASISKNLQVVIMTEGQTAIPSYITDQFTDPNNSLYHTPVLWDSTVMDRLIALFNAFATQYDANTTVESVGTWRTDLAISDADKTTLSYSASAYITQLQRLVSTCKPNLANTVLLLGVDDIPDASDSAISSFVSNVASNGGGFCAPDLYPPAGYGQGYPVMASAKAQTGTAALGADMLASRMGGTGGEFSPEEVLTYAGTQLNCNYVCWTDTPAKNTPRYRFTNAIIPAIDAYGNLLPTTEPSNL